MIYLFGYIASILLANVLITVWGTIPVGFGLYAPAAVIAAGAALGLRDGLQEAFGKRMVLVAILAGAGLSALVSPAFALASGAAFLVSELCDFAVYQPLRQRNIYAAVALSNTVGLVIDSLIFLWLAFGSLDFLAGQVLAKSYVTALTLLVMWAWRALRRRTSLEAA